MKKLHKRSRMKIYVQSVNILPSLRKKSKSFKKKIVHIFFIMMHKKTLRIAVHAFSAAVYA